MVDESTKKTLASIPLLKIKASPRDKGEWPDRLGSFFLLKVKYMFFIFELG
jgi:ufm1-conjugating enzyme 1